MLPTTILVLLPMTGTSASFGITAERAITLAQEHHHGREVRFEVVDTRSLHEFATSDAAAIGDSTPLAVLGEISSSRTLGIAAIAQAHGVPLLTPTGTSPRVTAVGDSIFRTCFIDPEQGVAMARYASRTLGATRVGILTDVRNDYAESLTKTFTATFPGEVERADYQEGDADFRAQLTTLLAARPDAVYLPGYYTEAAMIAKQARDQGYTGPFLGGDGWDSPYLEKIGGTAVEGGRYTTHWAIDSPGGGGFARAYERRWHVPADSIAALAYDAATMLLRAIDHIPAPVFHAWVQSPTPATAAPARTSIRTWLSTLRRFRGVTGRLTMGPDRNPQKPVYIVRIEGGVPVWDATVLPD